MIYILLYIYALLYILSCPPGTMISLEGNCVSCPSGMYCIDNASIVCPEGHFCGLRSSFPIKCQPEWKCETGSSAPRLISEQTL